MPRIPLASLVLVLAAVAARADDPPKSGGQVQMLLAKIEGDKLTTTQTSTFNRAVAVRPRDGKDGDAKTIQVAETTSTVVARDLKTLRATGTDDKDIPLDDLKDRFKTAGPVVFLSAPLDADWKKKFRPGTVFVEYAEPVPEKKKEDVKKDETKKDDNK